MLSRWCREMAVLRAYFLFHPENTQENLAQTMVSGINNWA